MLCFSMLGERYLAQSRRPTWKVLFIGFFLLKRAVLFCMKFSGTFLASGDFMFFLVLIVLEIGLVSKMSIVFCFLSCLLWKFCSNDGWFIDIYLVYLSWDYLTLRFWVSCCRVEAAVMRLDLARS